MVLFYKDNGMMNIMIHSVCETGSPPSTVFVPPRVLSIFSAVIDPYPVETVIPPSTPVFDLTPVVYLPPVCMYLFPANTVFDTTTADDLHFLEV